MTRKVTASAGGRSSQPEDGRRTFLRILKKAVQTAVTKKFTITWRF